MLMTNITAANTTLKWTEVKQEALEDMKHIVGKYYLLSYPNFSKEFTIHMDASKTQLRDIISQEKWPIVFYSRKLMPAQTRYTTTAYELLSIV